MSKNIFNGGLRDITNSSTPSVVHAKRSRSREGLKPKKRKNSVGSPLTKVTLFNYFNPTKRLKHKINKATSLCSSPFRETDHKLPQPTSLFDYSSGCGNQQSLVPCDSRQLVRAYNLNNPIGEINLLESSVEELKLSFSGNQFGELHHPQKDAFFRTFFHKLENDAGRGYKYGGYDKRGALRTVSGYTLSSIVSLLSSLPPYCDISILDCRSCEEFCDSHIKCSTNIRDDHQLSNLYKKIRKQYSMNPKRFYIFIFYCEFSSQRAPNLMKKFMALSHSNPVFLDNIFLLYGGYKKFHHLFKGFCEPLKSCPS